MTPPRLPAQQTVATGIPTPALAGQIAVVSGGAAGIGAAITLALTQAGAAVAVNHLDDHEAAANLSALALSHGADAFPVPADLRRTEQVTALCHTVIARHGRIDILVNNAGAYPRLPWDELTEEHWSEAIETNLTIHYRLTRAVSAHMLQQRSGRIINIGSAVARAGRAGLVAYSAAKAGLQGFTRSLARELGPSGICVNTVVPGAIEVEREQHIPPPDRTPVEVQLGRQCLPRRGQPTDIAAAVTFLAGPGASFITGQSLHVDGGWILH